MKTGAMNRLRAVIGKKKQYIALLLLLQAVQNRAFRQAKEKAIRKNMLLE